jgi:hypothetical protein
MPSADIVGEKQSSSACVPSAATGTRCTVPVCTSARKTSYLEFVSPATRRSSIV